MHTSKHDLIILGGGPAGMTAAIYAARANLDVVLIETAITGGLVNATYMVNNFPSYPAIHGMELMEKCVRMWIVWMCLWKRFLCSTPWTCPALKKQ